MTLSYVERLLCVSLASFYLLHLTLGAAVCLLTPAAIRMAGRIGPQGGASLLLAVRLMPMTVAGLFVACLCVPSYLWLEPEAAGEKAGAVCLTAALLGACALALSVGRGIGALTASLRRFRRFGRVARHALIAGEPAWVIDSESPLLGMAGVFRPRLIVSKQVLASLTPEQLDAAIRHEEAHRKSGDNLKRLVLLFAPGLAPFPTRLDRLGSAWMRLSESAADEKASGGNPRRSLALAEALVRVARLGGERTLAPLMTPFVGDEGLLEERVERLLHASPIPECRCPRMPALAAGLALLAAVAAVYPAILASIHPLLEELIH